MSTDKNIPKYLVENRGWTEQEAKEFVAEVERLKDLWYQEELNKPDITAEEALRNMREEYERTNGFTRIIQENEEHRRLNDQIRKKRLRRIELENRNLEWPKPDNHSYHHHRPDFTGRNPRND